ncbi:circumsporozoite protein-like [Brachypodium distachyon]|uniref:circumsporozoite protein-like n=1 Tax=Brachypodium distachyon TaxID=15368 RepID=UPI00052FFEB3|nr:circumsporozoite protein-like [Brachypodium distachyon]|eukprot:XP_010236403.1 circumsporozoite protein-like [Brachypodium distachyon]
MPTDCRGEQPAVSAAASVEGTAAGGQQRGAAAGGSSRLRTRRDCTRSGDIGGSPRRAGDGGGGLRGVPPLALARDSRGDGGGAARPSADEPRHRGGRRGLDPILAKPARRQVVGATAAAAQGFGDARAEIGETGRSIGEEKSTCVSNRL